jgi:hypothetical protein
MAYPLEFTQQMAELARSGRTHGAPDKHTSDALLYLKREHSMPVPNRTNSVTRIDRHRSAARIMAANMSLGAGFSPKALETIHLQIW